MEPKLPAPNLGPEQSQTGYSQNTERLPQLPTPETGLERGHERFEQRSEAPPVMVTPVLPPPVAAPVPLSAAPPVGALPAVDDGLPSVAGDDDLIEKEWVDKAKKIIVETKDDPYRREQEVGKLQADYQRKRYGRELGAPQ